MCYRYAPSQADVTVYSALSSAPDADKYPNAARWHKNIASYQDEFGGLPGDKSSDISKYGPAVSPAAAAGDGDDDDLDLFGSDDEEEDAEKEALAAKRLAEYRAKKALKPKTSTPHPSFPERRLRGCRETNPHVDSCQIHGYAGSQALG